MENVTHSLIGVVLGEGIYRNRNPREVESPQLRTGILWSAVVGSNLPDFDFLLRPILGGGGLGSLLHHRGFTHTVAFSILLAFIAAAMGQAAARSRVAWSALIAAGWLGVLAHICADFWNDYGVHPFWPFTNRWFYGDFIFIVEPLLLMALLPFAFQVSRTRLMRALTAALSAGLLLLCWAFGFMAWPVALAVTIWGALCLLVQRQVRGGVFAAFGSVLTVLVIFAGASMFARNKALKLLPRGEELLQMASTPSPGNPLCWRIWMTSRAQGAYFARLGVVGLAPGGAQGRANDPARCFVRISGERLSPLEEIREPAFKSAAPGMNWIGEFRGSIAELQMLRDSHCRLRTLLRFTRIPYWQLQSGRVALAGDLRYHSGKSLGFADIESREGEPCFRFEPPWDAPGKLFD